VFDTPAWFENLQLRGLSRPPEALHVMEMYRAGGGEPVGRLHLMRWDAKGPLLGVSNYYSSLFGPTWIDGVTEQADWCELAGRIRRLPGASVIRLQPLDVEGVFMRGMQAGLHACGYSVDRFFCFGNWYLPTEPGGFEAYWRQRPAQLRNTVERARRRLDRSHMWRIDIVRAPSPALEQGIAAYQRVYAQSWKEPEPNPAFMPGLIRMAADQGSLRLGLLWLDGEAVAAQVWVVTAGKAHIFKLAYQSGFERFSVGSVLTAALMQHVMDVDGVREVDYLTGDDNYKKDWMSHRRERVGLIAFDTSRPRGVLAWARHHAGKLYRRCVAREATL
jgi:CelD/BcsL family acetyltransferase involved in cellulose biosynthesis